MRLFERVQRGVLVMDGAMGTQIQARGVPAAAWSGREGCNEWLNITAPDIIRSIHQAYFAAGADAVETNSFGASPITLGEYDLADRALEINRAAACIAREAAAAAATSDRPRYVFGSIGPGTKLPTLGQVAFDSLCDALQVQIQGLAEGGADAILLETCQDLLQIKAGLVAFDKVLGARSDKLLYVSVTVEQTGTLLIGSNIAAVVAALAPFPIHALGLNCATGPEAMRIHLDYLAQNWPGFIACMPNAGLPVMQAGGAVYPLQPPEFAAVLGRMAREVGLHIVGGCCGTTPEHIRALRAAVDGLVAPPRPVRAPEQAASLFAPVDLTQAPPPLYIGERANATGSKKFRDALLANRYDDAFAILAEQEEAGAHVLDLSCAYAGRDEARDISLLVARAAAECRLPLMVDSTQANVIEAALKLYGGRMLVNSINFEAGEEKAGRVAELARRFGAGLVGLTIDEQGMALTADRKVQIARRLVEFGARYGLRPGDLFIDPLTFTIGSGDESLRDAAKETLAAIRRIKSEIPGARVLLGLSNISFGLKPQGRKVLNAVFLDRCLKAGMDACIINVAAIEPLNQIPAAAARVATALLDNDRSAGDPLENFIRFFEGAAAVETARGPDTRPPEAALADAVIKGRIPPLAEVIPALLTQRKAEDILNEILVPAMKEVGRLFNDGVLQLPFVLKSAEVMKRAVDLLKPHMQKDDAASGRGTLVIATVAGDVHDIGKNLVDIILSNNGFRVVNLGTKIPVEQMIAAVREHQADVLGMSGLLVKSAALMAENLKALEAAGVRVPVLLGGAALTPDFVAEVCQPLYSAPVVYCRDAFAGLARMRERAERGGLEKTPLPGQRPAPPAPPPAPPATIDLSLAPPAPPFLGRRIVREIDLEAVYPLLNEVALIRGRWGYRRGKLDAAEYQRLMDHEVYPKLAALKKAVRERGLFKPQVAYGYFPCRAWAETLFVRPADGGVEIPLTFPRQRQPPHYCVAGFFRPDADVVGFMAVTLGGAIEKENPQLLFQAQYQDYFLLHGLAVEVTDALAEYWHAQMRREWGFRDPDLDPQGYIVQNYRGSRYGFGYPACPDLAMNKICCDLVGAAEIGITLSENYMMVPELSTCALVAHHPQAKYFNV